jgi:hypothetical protein
MQPTLVWLLCLSKPGLARSCLVARLVLVQSPLLCHGELTFIIPRGGLLGGRGVPGRRRGWVDVGLLRLEGGGEERVGGGERVVAEAEEVEEGLAVWEGTGGMRRRRAA